MKEKFTFLLFSLFVVLSFPALSQNTALSFNGTNTYVSTTASIVPTTGDFTVEFWTLVPAVATGQTDFLFQGTPGTGSFFIGTDQATGNITAGDNWSNTTVPMPVNVWAHIALVNSGGTASLFINGILKASQPGYSVTAGGSPFNIGSQSATGGFTNGTIDELRIWNVARTAAQLRSGLFNPVSTSAPGLVAYYGFNEGSGTSLNNSTSTTGITGTLVNAPSWVSSPIQFSANALNFDGAHTKVLVPNNAAFEFTSGTIELAFNPSSSPHAEDLICVRGPSGSRFSFEVDVNNNTIGLWNSLGLSTIPYTFTVGTWYRIAFVIDPSGTTVFVNGVQQAIQLAAINPAITGEPLTIGLSYNGPGAGSDGDQFTGSIDEVRVWNTQRTQAEISTNMALTLTGSEAGLVSLYSFDQGVPNGDNSNLVTVIDNSPNNFDGTTSFFNLSGSTSNFVPGTNTPLPVNFTAFTVTGRNNQALLQWQTAQEQNSSEYVIERSADGKAFTSIGSVPAAGNSHSPRNFTFTDPAPENGINYYQLKEIDLDGKFMYSVIRTLNLSAGTIQKLVWYRTGDKSVEVDLQNGNNENYSVVDLNGRVIQQGQFASGKMFLNQIPAGLYIVKAITASGQTLNTKVLIQ